MYRMIIVLGILAASLISRPLSAQSTRPPAGLSNNRQLPSFVDSRPVPEYKLGAQKQARDKHLRTQQQKIQRLTAREVEANRRAKRAAMELKKQLALNAEIESRRTADQAKQNAQQEHASRQSRELLAKQQFDAAGASNKQSQQIKDLEAQKRALEQQLSERSKQRDSSRDALSAAQLSAREWKVEVRDLKIKLDYALKAQSDADQSQRAAELANRHGKQEKRNIATRLSEQTAARRTAQQTLQKAQLMIAALRKQLNDLKAAHPRQTQDESTVRSATSSTPATDDITLARRKALAEARRRARAAELRAKTTN